MPGIPSSEIAKLDMADLAASKANDESSMEALLDETPVIEEGGAEPQQTTKNPNDAAVEAASRKAADDEEEREKKKTAPKAPEPDPNAPKKPEAPVGDEDPAKKVAEEEDKSLEEEVEQAIKDIPKVPENAPKHVKDAMKAMRGALKKHLKTIRDKDSELQLTAKQKAEIEQKLTEAAEIDVEDYRSLKEIRAIYAIQNDPDFKKNYDKPIQDQEAEAVGILQSLKVPEEVVKWINDEGGLTEFYYSDKPVIDPDTNKPLLDSKGKVISEARWFQENVMAHPALSARQRDKVHAHVLNALSLAEKRDKAIAEARANIPEWEKKQAEKAKEQEGKLTKEMSEAAAAEGESIGIYAQTFTPKADATEEQKQQIKEHNDRVERATKVFDSIVADKSPQAHARAAVRAALSFQLLEINGGLVKKNDQLQKDLAEALDKIDRIKNAGKTANRGSAPPPGSQREEAPKNETDEQAMERHMRESLDGKK